MCKKEDEIKVLKEKIAKLELMLDSISRRNKQDATAELKARRMVQFCVLACQFLFKDPTNDEKYKELKNLAKNLPGCL